MLERKSRRGGWLALLTLLLLPTKVWAQADALCAEVKIEISQQLTLERQGFEAVMRINNPLTGIELNDIEVTVNFADANNRPVVVTSSSAAIDSTASNAPAFFIRHESSEGFLQAPVDGENGAVSGGRIPGASVGELRWLIVPTVNAVNEDNVEPGETDPRKLFLVGATLKYSYDNIEETVVVAPDSIVVKPLPELSIQYFLPRDVFGDNPETDTEELVEPYTLGVRLSNNGLGLAGNMKLESAQPVIVNNDKGLLIDFSLLGSYVGNQSVSNSLLLNFGDMGPGDVRMGRWIAETSLTGEYVEFNASYTHADELGGALTSLIDEEGIKTYWLVKDVMTEGDQVLDYLATTGGALDQRVVFASEAIDSNIAGVCDHCSPVGFSATAASLGSPNGAVQPVMISNPGTGYQHYELAIDKDFSDNKAVLSVRRGDGRLIAPENVWFSKKRINPDSWKELSYHLNVFDKDPSSQYNITFKGVVLGPVPPRLEAILDHVIKEGEQKNLFISATDANGTVPSLSAKGLPAGASFVDEGGGKGLFRWIAAVGQAGRYDVTFTASDGVLKDTKTTTIIVTDGEHSADYYADADNDGYSLAEGDSDDGDPAVNPGAIEICGDGIDQDSDGQDMPCLEATGDVNGDGLFTAQDVLLAQRHVLALASVDVASRERGDLYSAPADSQLTAADVLLITQRVLLNMPVSLDTDGDMIPDSWESQFIGSDPLVADATLDSDGDGLSNAQEYYYQTHPGVADSDGDGFDDREEVAQGTDPTAAGSYPVRLTSIPVTEVAVGQLYQYTLSSNHAGASFEIVQAPMAMTLVGNIVQWQPSGGENGEAEIILRATVDGLPSIDQSYTLTVFSANGDIDNNGSIDAKDLLLQQGFAMGLNTPTPEQLYRGDLYPVNAPDGKIDASDLLLLQRHVLGGQ